jgi:hypothetical protein
MHSPSSPHIYFPSANGAPSFSSLLTALDDKMVSDANCDFDPVRYRTSLQIGSIPQK